MATARWNGTVIADSDTFEVVEGNVYFPPDAVDRRFVRDSDHSSVCGWKGTARYYDLVVDGAVNRNAAWYYPDAKDAAKNIQGFVAFWNGVDVER